MVGDGGGLSDVDGRRNRIAGYDAVQQPRVPEGRPGDGFAAHDHVQRPLRANQPRQALGPTGTGDEAELDLGEAESGVAGGDTVVGREGELQSATQADARNRCDHRFWAGLDLRDELGQGRGGQARRRAEFSDVGAAGPEAARTREHDGAHGTVGLSALERRGDPRAHGVGQSVDGRVGEGDDGGGALDAEGDLNHRTPL